jgi:phage baseplate assembly protein W
MRNRPQYRINTLDLNPNQGVGVALPFNPTNIFTINYTTTAQIKSNLLNFMLTNSGERVFNPNFGADIRNLIFEPNTDLTEVKSALLQKIGLYFPSITVNSLDFNPSVDNNSLSIVLNYTVNKQTDRLVIQIA